MGDRSKNAELTRLLDALCDERITTVQFSRLQELLHDDPEAQRTYLTYIDLHLGLKRLAAVDSSKLEAARVQRGKAATVRRAPRRRFGYGSGLALSLLVVAIAVALFMRQIAPASREMMAKVTKVSGSVLIADERGQARVVEAEMQVFVGERVTASGSGASAVVTFDDGTRLTLVNDSSASFVAGKGKSVVLHYGIISARVAPQPADRSMSISAPGAHVEVVGTRFALAAAADRMELDVLEGQVRLTRLSDGQTVDVRQGQRVVTGGGAKLAVRDSAEPKDEWTADFEGGIPSGWKGAAIAADLPTGSSGAIGAVRDDGSDPVVHVVASREHWVEGLFAVHEDTHLHITMKMDRPDWLNVFMSSRDSDATKPKWTLHLFNEVPFWPPRPGEWRTVSIPLSKFRSKRDEVFYDTPPEIGAVVYSLAISFTEPDRGLVVDRIWTTRGGLGKVETVPLH